MQPIVYPFFSRSSFGLSYFIGMMYPYMVYTALVNIDLFSQILHTHGRTFDMPAGIASSPRRIPDKGLIFKLALCKPKNKVMRIAFVFIYFDTGTGFKVFKVYVCQLSVFGKGRNIIVEVSASHVGVPVRFYSFYKLYHFIYVLCSLADNTGPFDIQPFGIVKKGFCIKFCNFKHRFSAFFCRFYHLIFTRIFVIRQMPDIGYIHNMGNIIT